MSLIDTAGRSGRFLTRAQNRAITIESAPRSSKKLLSTDTRSTCITPASTSANALSVLELGGSARSAVKVARACCTTVSSLNSGGPRGGAQFIGTEHLLAVQIQHPAGVVDGVEIALAEVWGDSDRGEVLRSIQGQPVHGSADYGAGGTAEQESLARQSMAGTDGVALLDTHHLVHVGLIKHGRADTHPQPRDHPASRRATKGHRPHSVHPHDPPPPVPLPEVAGAAHQGAAGPASDKQHVKLGELPSDGRRRPAVVRLPVLRIGVLIQPDVAIVRSAYGTGGVD